MQLYLLINLAIKNKHILKNADIKQAFVQSILPPEESYIIHPPPGCLKTPPNTYWKLNRTLYGLRRSARHWFDRATEIPKSIGLQLCNHSPCLFKGTIIPDKPPPYLSLYVDDHIYYSTDDDVEKAIETKLNKITTTDFMGKVSRCIGLKFQWNTTSTSVSVHLYQEAFTQNLIGNAGLDNESSTYKPTQFHSGYPIDSIPSQKLTPGQTAKYKIYIICYWIITMVIPIHPLICYLKGTANLGTAFHSSDDVTL